LYDIQRREGEVIARVRVSKEVESDFRNYKIHPVLLDAAFQSVALAFATGQDSASEDTYLAVRIKRVRLYPQPGGGLWVHLLLRPHGPNDDLIEADVWLLDEDGAIVTHAEGLGLQRIRRSAKQEVAEWIYETAWERKPLSRRPHAVIDQSEDGYWLLLSDNRGVAESLKSLLEGRGENCLIVRAAGDYKKEENGDYSLSPDSGDESFQLIKDVLADHKRIKSVVHLWSLDVGQAGDATSLVIKEGLRIGAMSALYLVQALVRAGMRDLPKLWLVTRGVHRLDGGAHPVAIAQAPLWGLGRTISHEHSGLSCCNVDLMGLDEVQEAAALYEEVASTDTEDEVAWRGMERYVGRLKLGGAKAITSIQEPTREAIGGIDRFSLGMEQVGVDSLRLYETKPRAVGVGEVEIAVEAAGLNFLDVLWAMGERPDDAGTEVELGGECAGRITAVGEGVEGLTVGEGVVALAPGCLGSFAVTKASLVVKKPAALGFEEAATLPIAFLTAYYGLVEVARLRKGERVLIHSATGGVGLAAIQIARQMGAEVFATAGTEEKRGYLRKMGIDHVMGSRTATFCEAIKKLTSGKGIDVVLNSLTGQAIEEGLDSLAPYGRFVEIGKKDISANRQIGLGVFKNNLSYMVVDLARLVSERSEYCGEVLGEIVRQVEEGRLKALPIEKYNIGEAAEAFRRMAQGRHIGKIVMKVGRERATVRRRREGKIRPDGVYLITGGLSGIGLLTGSWLVEQGARHVVLMGRSEPSTEAKVAIEEMRNAGAEVEVVRGDVGDEAAVNKIVGEITSGRRRLRGVIHSAGVLADGTLLGMDQDKMERMSRAKVWGSWNLAKATSGEELDLFVLYSSMASMLGSPGQGNYAAGNGFMDALAVELVRLGRAALSISWGPWTETGFASRPESSRLLLRGMMSIDPDQAFRALDYLLNRASPPPRRGDEV